uniref:hypothetical protein n=1 Tax=Faecalibacterium sp. TaxID=1971605 RepID=UPI0040284E1E
IQLVDGVRGVGDQLPQENFLVGVDLVDQHIHQLFALCLKFFLGHSTKPLFLSGFSASTRRKKLPSNT